MLDKMSEKVLNHIARYQLELYEGNAVPNFQSHLDKIEGVNPKYIRNIVKQLDSLSYVNADMNAHRIGAVSLTHLGEEYLKNSKTAIKEKCIRNLHDWINTITAFLALVCSIISLFA